MEVIAFSVLSAVLLNVVCLVSYLWYKRYRASIASPEVPLIKQQNANSNNKPANKKANSKKEKLKKNPPKKKPRVEADDDSASESFTTQEQLFQTIMHQQNFMADSINTTAVNAKPTVKKLTPAQRGSSKMRKDSSSSEVYERDPDWENVTSRKKKKIYSVTKVDEKFEFTLDEEGGIVELPFCEIQFPAESVLKPLHISMELEKYEKFVDDAEDKVFVTPAVHFLTSGDSKLRRQFIMKLNSMKMMGRGWDGNACCQIETRDVGGSWMTTGRTEYLLGKPVQIIGDDLTSFRVVITRSQNSLISRGLNIAAYITKPKSQNPANHYLHICIYDRSQQTEYKVNNNMQKLLLKMPPRECVVPFGANVEFRVQPTQKYTPDDKDVFMRWTEVCKAFVNVRFQIRLNRNGTKNPNFEAEFRTMVFLLIKKVGTTQTSTQEEYFHFYWMSATYFPKSLKFKGQKGGKGKEADEEKISEDDGFASGSDVVVTPEPDGVPFLMKPTFQKKAITNKPPVAPKVGEPSKKRRNAKKNKENRVSAQSADSTKPISQKNTYSSQSKENKVQSTVTKEPASQENSGIASVKHDHIKNNRSNEKKMQFPKKVQSNSDQISRVANASTPRPNPHSSEPKKTERTVSHNRKATEESKKQPPVPNPKSNNPPNQFNRQRRVFRYHSPTKKNTQPQTPVSNGPQSQTPASNAEAVKSGKPTLPNHASGDWSDRTNEPPKPSPKSQTPGAKPPSSKPREDQVNNMQKKPQTGFPNPDKSTPKSQNPPKKSSEQLNSEPKNHPKSTDVKTSPKLPKSPGPDKKNGPLATNVNNKETGTTGTPKPKRPRNRNRQRGPPPSQVDPQKG